MFSVSNNIFKNVTLASELFYQIKLNCDLFIFKIKVDTNLKRGRSHHNYNFSEI